MAFGMTEGLMALLAALGMFKGGGSAGSAGGGSATLDPMMQGVLREQQRRMEGQGPLFDAIQQLAMNLMPTNVQRGLPGLGGVPIPRPRPEGPEGPGRDDVPGVPPPGVPGAASWSSPDDLRRRRIQRGVPTEY